MEFTVQSPEVNDIQFDRNDLLGISLGGDDPIFKRGLALDNMYRGIVDESGAVATISIEDGINCEVENDDDILSDPGVLDMMPDDTDLSMEGMDVDDEIEASNDILSGKADDDIDILDYVDSMPLQEEVKNVSSKDVQNAIQGKINSVSKNSVTAEDIQKKTATTSAEESAEEISDVDMYAIETAEDLDALFDEI